MPRAQAPCGDYAAYRRHLRKGEKVDAKCRKAQREHDRTRSTSAPARAGRAAAKKPATKPGPASPPDIPVLPAAPVGGNENEPSPAVSRLEVLKELLKAQRELLPALRRDEPARAYLLMREQRETLREIDDLQTAASSKGATLADQLAQARAARAARAAGA